MKVNDAIEVVQQDIATNLNAWIASHDTELEELTYHDDAPRTGIDEHYMGIYLSSPEGEVYQNDGKMESVDITLDCIIDDKRESVNLPQRYLSCILEYLSTRTYGIRSHAYTAVTARVDLDAPVNAFAIALRIVIAYAMDYDL